MSSSKKIVYRDFEAVVYLSEVPSQVLFGVVHGNFVGSESSQIQCVNLLQNIVYNRTQHPPSPSQPHTVCIYCTLIWGGGRVDPERRLEGQQFTKIERGRKYKHD
jgi:hypothetical protein